MPMDWGKLLQGVGGRLHRQALGVAMREGTKRIGGAQGPVSQDRGKSNQSRDTQKRLQQMMRIGRRFWK
jgi:hypothetical protein